MSRRGARLALVIAMGVLAGCASSKVQVSRTPWVKSPPRGTAAQRTPHADTTAARAQAPSQEAPPSAPPVDEKTARVESVTNMRDREPPVLDSSVSSVPTDAPDEEQAQQDSFAKTFSGAGTVQEVGEDEILRAWPADADSTGPAASVPPRVTPDVTPPTASGNGDDVYGAISAPPARQADGKPTTSSTPRDGDAMYVVQLYAFPTRTAADFASRQAARSLGVESWVEEVRTAAVPFKVYAGRFATRPPADSLRARAQKNGFPEAFVATRAGGK